MQFVPGPGKHDSPWESITVTTPSGTYTFPPSQKYGAVKVQVTSKARKEQQKAAGRGKAKTKKSGPEPLDITIELTFFSWQWDDIDGAQAIIAALDPNAPEAEGGPFDFQYPDFNRRGGKSIDIDEVGAVTWSGQIGTCTIKAREWVAEPPKDAAAQGTKTPTKSTEYLPGVGDNEPFRSTNNVTLAQTGIADIAENLAAQARREVVAQKIAQRGFSGPNQPDAKP